MARSGDFTVRVDNLKELQREVRKAQGKAGTAAMRKANRETAKIVADEAQGDVPRRSGKLARSIAPASSVKEAVVKAGTAKGVPYAGPIHFGWKARNITPQPFLFHAAGKRMDDVLETFEKAILEALSSLDS